MIHECTIRHVAIKNLPDGWFKTRFTDVTRSTDALVTVVAKPGTAQDWAAYIGWPPFETLTEEAQQVDDWRYYCTLGMFPERIMRYGDKISEEEAIALFPRMNATHKRGYRS